MVHKLRKKNVCKSTPTTDERIFSHLVFPRPKGTLGRQNIYLLEATPLTRNHGGNTEGILHSTVIQTNISPHRDNNNNINNDETAALDYSAIQGNSAPAIAMISHLSHGEDEPVLEENRPVHNNTMSYCTNICAAIDEIVFNKTYKRRGGISLYAVKKVLNEEYGYKTTRFSKIPTKYIAESIAMEKFRQISGRGANGKFRLNINQRNRLKIQSKTIDKNKSKSQSTLLNRRKRQQLSLLATKIDLNDAVESQVF